MQNALKITILTCGEHLNLCVNIISSHVHVTNLAIYIKIITHITSYDMSQITKFIHKLQCMPINRELWKRFGDDLRLI